MKYDDYAGAVDFEGLEKRLQRCTQIDEDFPSNVDQCAEASAKSSICPCIASEESICSALTASISEAMYAGGYSR